MQIFTAAFVVFLYSILSTGCTQKTDHNLHPDPLFSLLPSGQTGIDFTNTIEEYPEVNILSYQYFYNGGGVATGDVNGDGLEDIYFSGNYVQSRLYLNKGGMRFDDVTSQTGVGGKEPSWKTGVTMADVNGDGRLDIYQCYSGGLPAKDRVNRLYINMGNQKNGIPRFEEQGAKYGLADSSYSTHAVFFDLDRDNDLDLFLLNHNPRTFTTLDESTAANVLNAPAPMIRMKLFKNEKDFFTDVSAEAGIYNSSFSYGLGAGVADINSDGWPDLYISNDYSAPDYLYVNNQDGTFTDVLNTAMGHTSLYSMGNDIADINNDGFPDILTLDMLPEDNRRQKLLFSPDNYEYYNLRLRLGFHHQDMRNMLHINNGNGTFSEVGQLAGISNTDWSWAPLFADYDNDGWKDLFVTNGYLRDYTNMDFLKYRGDYISTYSEKGYKNNLLSVINQIPSSDVKNYIFRNNHDLTFSDNGDAWGINQASNSNGAAYADLDNDGDLDLVVNNINKPAFVYQNQSSQHEGNHALRIKLKGAGRNTQGIGAKITVYSGGIKRYIEQMPSRGYQSSVSPILHFGLGKATVADSVQITWPTGKTQLLSAVKAGPLITIKELNAQEKKVVPVEPAATLFAGIASPVNYEHPETAVNDFKRQPLLVNPLSFGGPCLVKGDFNKDGADDVFAGGGGGKSGKLFLGRPGGSFIPSAQPALEADDEYEDADALFFDANGDTFTDLYVVSGGYGNLQPDDKRLQDRLYINDGRGRLTRSPALPAMQGSKSCVRSADFNADGLPDLFIGGRTIPGRYPEAPPSYLLINKGNGRFADETARLAPQLRRLGMVTDAAWTDLNADGKADLVLVGEWMPITALIQTNGRLEDRTLGYFGQQYSGWWNRLLVADLNNDKRPDVLAGNMGLNSQFRATQQHPTELFYKDFDDNGSVDPILCTYIQGKSYPYVTRDELLDQISMMRTRFADYKSYADAALKDIFTPAELRGAGHLKANTLKTSLFLSTATGKFKDSPLPLQAQFTPVYAILAADYDQDGTTDLMLGGNISRARLRMGNTDAGYGTLLKGNGRGGFSYIPQHRSGLTLKGDVRSILQVNNTWLFGINQRKVAAYQYIGGQKLIALSDTKTNR